MAERPAIQLYLGDWKKNQKLRFCSWAARAVWLETMALMHDSDEYGVLHKSLKDIAQALGAPRSYVNELVTKGVMKGIDKGMCDAFEFRPKHAGVEGDAVVLIPEQEGPLWYSSRMVKDEYVRQRRGANTRFGDSPKQSPKGGFGDPPKDQPNQRQGDGASTSSSSSQVGNSSTRGEGIEVVDGNGSPLDQPSNSQGDDAAAMRIGVPAAKALRAIGIRVTALDPTLLALCREEFSVGEMALMAAEQVLRKASLWDDSDMHPDLPELLANAAKQQVMLLTDPQYAAIQSAAADMGIAYIAKVLRGRRQDAIDNQSPSRGSAKKVARKHPANENFEGKIYVGTPVDQLSPDLRAAVERELSGSGS